MNRKTKKNATIGPSLMSQKKIEKIIDEGANVLRINFTHGSLEDHENVINWIKSLNKKVAIMQDIQGPKIRTGDSEANTVLEKSKSVKIVNGNLISNSETICIKYEDLFKDINIDDRVFIDDGSTLHRLDFHDQLLQQLVGLTLLLFLNNQQFLQHHLTLNTLYVHVDEQMI